MKNFRFNPVTGQWVIVAEGRELRPNEFRPNHQHQPQRRCPFCLGHEDDTPGEVAALDKDGKPTKGEDWRVRVVPNKYPVLRFDEPFNFEVANEPIGQIFPPNVRRPKDGGVGQAAAGLQQPTAGPPKLTEIGFRSGGIHELIVESARHVSSFAELTTDECQLSIQMYQRRIERSRELGLAYAMVFKNCRPDAGASIDHVHSQLIGTPLVPRRVIEQCQRAEQFAESYGQTMAMWLRDQEVEDGSRIVAEDDEFWAFCPYASHMMFEVWVMPRDPMLQFLDLAKSQTDQLGRFVRKLVRGMESILNDPPYNFTLHLPPLQEPDSCQPAVAGQLPSSGNASLFPWRLEITPRLNKTAGFEWGTGCMILATSPETAADRLRAAIGKA